MLLKLEILLKKVSPKALALGYCLLSILTSFVISAFEGTLAEKTKSVYMGNEVLVFPLIYNFSTLLDFLILNPLILYFFLKAKYSIDDVYSLVEKSRPLSLYHQKGLLITLTVVATICMQLYYSGFFDKGIFDAVIQPDSLGVLHITATGYVVYFWTALFLALMFYFLVYVFEYAFFIISLNKIEIDYQPYHHDEAAGLHFVMKPILSFGTGMLLMLLMFLVFAVYDFLFFGSSTLRMVGLYIYLLVIFPTFFLPYYKLHIYMLACRNQYLVAFQMNFPIVTKNQFFSCNFKETEHFKEFCNSFESQNSLRKTLLAFPVWPLPPTEAISKQTLAVIVALIPPIIKLFTAVSS